MKRKIKILTDVLMVCLLLFQMSYSLIGEARHKWHGIALLVLFVFHNLMNRGFYKSLFRGKYGPFRVLQMILAFLAVLSMAGAMISGLSMAGDIVPLKLRGSTARELHMISVYWGFVILSLHLGLHWGVMLDRLKKKALLFRRTPGAAALRAAGVVVAAYGVYAFMKRDIGLYMTLLNQFVFFDFEEPLVFFILDYLAVMGLFVWAGYYMAEWLKRFSVRKFNI